MTEIILANNNLPSTIEDLAKFVLIGRDRMTAVRAEIRAIDKLGLASTVHKQKLAEAQDIAEVVLDAEAKLGEMMIIMPKSTGGRPATETIPSTGKSKKEALSEFGFSTSQADRLETLSEYPEIVAQAKAKARDEGRIVTQSEVLKEVSKAKQEIKRTEINNPNKLPDGVFQVIYCDPPWQYNNSGFNSSAEQHYPTMDIETLKAMPVKDLKAENAVMFMWATNPLLKQAIELMEVWGFEYKTNIVWVKDRQINLGFYVYGKHELLLIGTAGSMLPTGEKPPSVMEGKNNIHSKKPESTYETIETMYPGLKCVELFARNTPREGWVKWGNEVGKYE